MSRGLISCSIRLRTAVLLLGRLSLVLGDGQLGRTVGQAHAQSLDDRRHGVRRIHSSAGTGARNGLLLDLHQLFMVDCSRCMGPNRLEYGYDIQILVLVDAGQVVPP